MADDTDRWTVRGVPKAYQERAAEAAGRRRITLGAYVCRALDRELRAEREPAGVVVAADKTADMADMAADSARLALIERAVAASVALAGAPDVPEVPVGFRRRANRLLREGLAGAAVRVVAGRGGGGVTLP